MVDRTNYTDDSELTYQEKNHPVTYCTEIENYNAFYRNPPNYGQYVPLVHVLNHNPGKIFYYYDIRASFAYF